MGLNDFLDNKEMLGDNYDKFVALKSKFEKEGFPENISVYKAMNHLTPEKLEKINLMKDENPTYKTSIEFFFNDPKDIKLVAKFFKISMVRLQVGDSTLLVELLKLLDKEETK